MRRERKEYMAEPTKHEVRVSLGFLKIDDGPIDLDYDHIELKPQNYGADPLSADLVVMRDSFIQLDKPKESMSLDFTIKELTFRVVRWIERYRVPGELVFHYETITQGWDMKVICKAYRRETVNG
jgi:hypothetical protein